MSLKTDILYIIMLAPDQYKSITSPVEGPAYKEKGSKFIGFAFPVQHEDEIKDHLNSIRKQHHSARHYCYAYQLGFLDIRSRSNDDGEPSNSAGMPILGQINSAELNNILIIVVRYYGGTKLGVGGLIQAYKTAARQCIEVARTRVHTLRKPYKLEFDYPLLNHVMHIIKENDIEIIDQNMMERCNLTIGIREKQLDETENKLQNIYGLTIITLDD